MRRAPYWVFTASQSLLSAGEAPLRGDAELTEALRGGKQRANLENKQPEPRPRGRKTSTCVGNIPEASVARGGERRSQHTQGLRPSVPLDWSLSVRGLYPAGRDVNPASPQHAGGVQQTLLE